MRICYKRCHWTEVKKIHNNKSSIQNKVDDTTGSVDIANAFADQYRILYSSVPSEPTYLSELLMRVKTSVRNICQHNYYCMQHCHFVNSTQISDVIKRLRFGKSDGVDDLYSYNFKHGTSLLFHCISVIINCVLCHGYAPTSFFYMLQLYPFPRTLSIYRAIALSNIFSKNLDKTIMSLQSEYLMTSELQFGFKEHSSTIMCSTLLAETVEYYVSNNSTVYVLLIDVSKAFDILWHSKLFEVLESHNVFPLVRRLLYNIYSRSEIHVQWNSTQSQPFSLNNGVKQGGVLSQFFSSIYNDSLLQKLKDSGLGCQVGRTLQEHSAMRMILLLFPHLSVGCAR